MIKPVSAPEESRFIERIHELGDNPLVYASLRKMMGADRYRQNFLDRAIGADFSKKRILDLGCGTGEMATVLSGAERYVGMDASGDYIRYARENAEENELQNAEFLPGDITYTDFSELGEFDCVIAMGVLHHLHDDGVNRMLQRVIPALSDVGKVATTDVMRKPDIHWSASFMINNDRGSHVRDAQGYIDLMSGHFENVRGEEMMDGLEVPVTKKAFPQFITVSSDPIEAPQ